MKNEPVANAEGGARWRPVQVYLMASACLAVGLAVGYLFRGSQSTAAQAPAAESPGIQAGGHGSQMPSLDQMKHMAEKKTEPLFAKLQSDPNNAGLLIQIGGIYQSTHLFKEAAEYYGKSLQIDPKNVAIRTEMSSCLYYSGDADGAMAQLQQALEQSPNDANALFNLGVIRLDAKKDAKGAVSAWQQLLKTNPTLDARKKAAVEKLIADANKAGSKG